MISSWTGLATTTSGFSTGRISGIQPLTRPPSAWWLPFGLRVQAVRVLNQGLEDFAGLMMRTFAYRVVSLAISVLLPFLLRAPEVASQDVRSLPFVDIEYGDLSVRIRDNSQSPQILSGLNAMFNTRQASGFDAYDPDTQGASGGLNFEHIISGHATPNNRFTPRHGPYSLQRMSNGRSVSLTRKAEDSPWKVASTLKYTIAEPHYVDFDFQCRPQDSRAFGDRQYAIFFFANYMNDVEDASLHFRGYEGPDAAESWIIADAPKQHPDWNRGGNYRARDADNLQYDDGVEFRLNTWSYEWPRIAEPFYFGRARHGMTLILMFDRLCSQRDQIRFSPYKFKLPKHPRPAWDFQYVINRVEPNNEYGFRGRLVWKKFVSADDCRNEYLNWKALISSR